MDNKYEEIVKLQQELRAKQLVYIKEALVTHTGSVELDFKPVEAFSEEEICEGLFDDQFIWKTPVEGRHGQFWLNITRVYEQNNILRMDGINDDDRTIEKGYPVYEKDYDTVSCFIFTLI